MSPDKHTHHQSTSDTDEDIPLIAVKIKELKLSVDNIIDIHQKNDSNTQRKNTQNEDFFGGKSPSPGSKMVNQNTGIMSSQMSVEVPEKKEDTRGRIIINGLRLRISETPIIVEDVSTDENLSVLYVLYIC